MPEMLSSSIRVSNIEWAKTRKKQGEALRKSAVRIADALFQSGDLMGYMRLLSRFPYFHVHNLLLILQQYPNATALKGLKEWSRIYKGTFWKVLQPEWEGKGIDLIAPFTDCIAREEYELKWYSIKVFDISQTKIDQKVYDLEYNAEIIQDVADVVRAVTAVISLGYNLSVSHTPSDAELKKFDLPGSMDDQVILVRDDIKPIQQLSWLLECLIQLKTKEMAAELTPPQTGLLIEYIQFCVLSSWKLEESKGVHQNPVILSEIPKEKQISFLDIVQKTTLFILDAVDCELNESSPVSDEEDEEDVTPDFSDIDDDELL